MYDMGTRVIGLTHLHKSHFLHVSCNILICKVLLSYFVFFGLNFDYYAIKHLL